MSTNTKIKQYNLSLSFISLWDILFPKLSYLVISFISVFVCETMYGQSWLLGVVKDEETHEPLIGVNILSYPDGTYIAQTTDNGYYRLNTALVQDSCVFRYIGYTDFVISVQDLIQKEGNIFIREGLDLETILVVSKSNRGISQNNLSLQTINNIPTIGAKPDVLKAFQTLPSVSGANEGSSLLLVRGGNPGENLYLLDETPIIYVNHLGGFFSVFNPDMISAAKIYKGGFPATYNGKLSSVVSISQREGNKKYWRGSLSLGFTDASFSVEGPIIKERMSVMLTGRKTLTDPLMRLAFYLAGERFSFAYGFHDINTKITYNINNKNSISFNLYQGDDYFTFRNNSKTNDGFLNSKNQNIWGNWLAAIGMRNYLNDKTSLYHNISFNRYRVSNSAFLKSSSDKEEFVVENIYVSSLQNFRYKGGLKNVLMDRWFIDTGVEVVNNHFEPSSLSLGQDLKKIISNDIAIYADNQILLNEKLTLDIGIRIQGYLMKQYDNISVEPRLEARYSLNETTSLYSSVHKQSQTAHLLFNSGQIGNNEIWIPSSRTEPVSTSVQYSLGYRNQKKDGNLSFEFAIYYRELNDLTIYKEGFTDIQRDPNWSNKLISKVSGITYGAELLTEYQHEKFNGTLSCAYGRSFRQSPEINKGHKFAFDFDRPHTLNLSGNYQFNKKLKIGFIWTLQSGLPFTPVIGRQYSFDTYFIEDATEFELFEAWTYGSKNSDRMRLNHRLDMSISLKTNTKKRDAEWTFSIYNVYNRKNPYFHFYNSPNSLNSSPVFFDHTNLPFGMYQVSFLPIIPSVSYRILFDKKDEKTTKKGFKEWMHW